jgi:CheY-like chemotaxis protein
MKKIMNNKIKVLIVDDNSDNVCLIRELLKDITTVQFEYLH